MGGAEGEPILTLEALRVPPEATAAPAAAASFMGILLKLALAVVSV